MSSTEKTNSKPQPVAQPWIPPQKKIIEGIYAYNESFWIKYRIEFTFYRLAYKMLTLYRCPRKKRS